MEIKSFFYNLTNVAKQAPLSNVTVLTVSKKDMKELLSYLDEENVSYTVDNEQDMRFTFQGQNFNVIENDKSEEIGADQKVIQPAQWDAVLSKEDEAVVAAQTDPQKGVTPLVTAPSETEVMKDHVAVTTTEAVEQQEETRAKESKKTK